MIFHTETGSIYEIDQANKQVRRLTGKNDPTPRQNKDEQWRKFSAHSPVIKGENVVFFWGDETNLLPETKAAGLNSAIPATITSLVVEIVDESKLS